MTTSKRHVPGDGGEKRWQAKSGEEQRQVSPDRSPAAPNPWYRRVSFWRAVAGMAIAIALGCAAIALEIASELSSRSTLFHRRMELMRSRILGLHSEAADAQRQLAMMRSERLARASVNHVLSAADMTLLRLLPATGSNARGLLAISRQTGTAIIEVAGLQPAAGRIWVLWWLRAEGPPAKAAETDPDVDGRLSLAVPLPPRGAWITGAIITLEPEPPVSQPKGRLLVKGMLPKPQILN